MSVYRLHIFINIITEECSGGFKVGLVGLISTVAPRFSRAPSNKLSQVKIKLKKRKKLALNFKFLKLSLDQWYRCGGNGRGGVTPPVKLSGEDNNLRPKKTNIALPKYFFEFN